MQSLGFLQLLGHLFFNFLVYSNQLLILFLYLWNQKLKALYFFDKLFDLLLILLLFYEKALDAVVSLSRASRHSAAAPLTFN